MALSARYAQWPAGSFRSQRGSELPALLGPEESRIGRRTLDVRPRQEKSEVRGLKSDAQRPASPSHGFGQGSHPFPDFFGDFGTALHGFFGEVLGVVGPIFHRLTGRIVLSAKVFSELFAGFGGEQQADQRAGSQPDQQEGDGSTGGVAAIGSFIFSNAHGMILSDLVVAWTISTVDFRRQVAVRGFLSLVNFCV